ncbi:MAG: Type fimbrial biosis protein PilY1 [Labilithrix sp.]|nr:Type fimbrial biosis protein PilY1 [Labilithrix sp.]
MTGSRWLWSGLLAMSAVRVLLACATSDDDSGKRSDGPDAHTLPAADSGSLDGAALEACAFDASACPPVDCAEVDFCSTTFPVSRLVALNAIWGSGPSDVWAVGSRGTILHCGDGATFAPVQAAALSATDVFVAVWGTSSTDVWVLGATTPARSDGFHPGGGTTFTPMPGSSWTEAKATTGRLWAGRSIGDAVWIAGEASMRFGASASLWSLDSSTPEWKSVSACMEAQPCVPALRALWAADANTLWAVGRSGQAFFFDAASVTDGGAALWLPQNSNTRDDLEGMWGSSANDVWAVGRNGVIRHAAKNEAVWSVASSGTTDDLHAVWGAAPNDVWAVGDHGVVVHFDGTSWSRATIGIPNGDVPPNLFAIWGSGPDDVWIAGEGILLHRTAANRRRP